MLATMTIPRENEPKGRSVLLAVVLSGLGPGAGHAYAGAPARGLLLVALWTLASWAWIARVSESYSAARLWGLCVALLLLAIIVDSGRLAGRAPRPFIAGPMQRWWTIALIVLATGFVLPTALLRSLERRAGLVRLADSSMEPELEALDRVVIRPGLDGLERGSIVALRGGVAMPDAEDAVRVRRVVGLPGELVELRGGHVHVNAQPWLQDPTRLTGLSRRGLRPTRVGPDELLVLPDHGPETDENPVVKASDVAGIARWVLLPADLDPLRVGAPIR